MKTKESVPAQVPAQVTVNPLAYFKSMKKAEPVQSNIGSIFFISAKSTLYTEGKAKINDFYDSVGDRSLGSSLTFTVVDFRFVISILENNKFVENGYFTKEEYELNAERLGLFLDRFSGKRYKVETAKDFLLYIPDLGYRHLRMKGQLDNQFATLLSACIDQDNSGKAIFYLLTLGLRTKTFSNGNSTTLFTEPFNRKSVIEPPDLDVMCRNFNTVFNDKDDNR